MPGMGGSPQAPLRGMGGMPSDPMGTGIKRGKQRKFTAGLQVLSRQADFGPVQGMQYGDLVIACLARSGSTIGNASGWTIIARVNESNSLNNLLVSYKFITSFDPETPNWTSADDLEYTFFRGVKAIGGSSTFSSPTNTTVGQAAAITAWGNLNSYELIYNRRSCEAPAGFSLILDSQQCMLSKGKLETAPAIAYTQSTSPTLSIAVELRSVA